MNLGEAGVGEERALFVSTISGGDVAAARIGGEIKNVSVPARSEDDGVPGVRFNFSSDQIARDDSFGVAVDQNELEHFGLRKHFDRARGDLPAKRLISAEQKLLPGLSPRVKRPGHLGAPKGAVREQTTVFARERHALLDALVDDEVTDFGQPVDVCFAGAEVASLDRVVEEAENAVPIILIIFRGVDPALGRDAVSAARAVLITETFHVVTELAQGSGGRPAGEPAADDDNLEFPAVVRSDQARVILVAGPLARERAGRNPGVETSDHRSCAGFTRCSKTATGMEV